MALLHLIAKTQLPKLSKSSLLGLVRPSCSSTLARCCSTLVQPQDHYFPKLVIPGETKGRKKKVEIRGVFPGRTNKLVIPGNNITSKTRRCLEPSLGEDGYFTFNKDIQQLQPKLLPVPHDYHCCGSSFGWLVLVDDSFKVQLFNPLSKVRFDLPSLTTLPPPQPNCTRLTKYYIEKAVISSDPTTSSTTPTTVLAVHGGCPQRISFCKIGDKAWTHLEGPDSEHRYYTDAIYYKNKFYALSVGGGCDIVDTDGPTVTPFAKEVPEERYFEEPYIIESNGHLFMAIRRIKYDGSDWTDDDLCDDCKNKKKEESNEDDVDDNKSHKECDGDGDGDGDGEGDYSENGEEDYSENDEDDIHCYRTAHFRVYKLEEESDGTKIWKRVEDIGNNAFFVGTNTSFALSTSNYMGRCKPNSIYFTDEKHTPDWMKEPIRHDIGVFSLKDNSVDSIFWVDSNPMRPPPFWFTPNPSC